MMNLNPDKNLYTVAPVGPLIIIGRAAALKSGIERKNALNLIASLIVATNASIEEIEFEIKNVQNTLHEQI